MDKERISFMRERKYDVTGTYPGAPSYCCTFETSVGWDIIQQATIALIEQFDLDVKYDIRIISIEEILKCEGCQYEILTRKHHMYHPSGCLHVSDGCGLC